MDDQSRIAELNNKATQLLAFLSFALVAVILLETAQPNVLAPWQKIAAKWSMRFWVLSLFPILVSVMPAKEWFGDEARGYKHLRKAKVVLLTFAILLVVPGAISFLFAVW